MPQFTAIPESEAPAKPRPASRAQAVQAEFESYVDSLDPGEVGVLTLDPDDNQRGIMLRISRAGARIDKPVATWAGSDGNVYFKRKD